MPNLGSEKDPQSAPAITRRRLLQATAAGALSPIGAQAATGLAVSYTDHVLTVRYDSRTLWSVDLTWLRAAADPMIEHSKDAAAVRLRGMCYPTSNVQADFDFALRVVTGRVAASITWCSTRQTTYVDLERWACGEEAATFPARPRAVRLAAVSLRQEKGSVTLQPDFALTFDGALTVKGKQLRGSADQCGLHPRESAVHPAARIRIASRASALTIHPEAFARHMSLRARPFAVANAQFEVEESSGGVLSSLQAAADGPVTLNQVDQRTESYTTVIAQDALFRQAATGEQSLAARRVTASAVMPGAVLRGRSSDESPVVICTRGSEYEVDCSFRWHSGAFMHGDGIVVTLRSLLTGADAPASKFLCATPWQPADLNLEGFELEFFRPEDSLWLRFRFIGFSLHRGFQKFVVQATGPHARMLMVFPPQAISEQAYFRAPRELIPPTFPTGTDPRDMFGVPIASEANEARRTQRNQPLSVTKKERKRDANDGDGDEKINAPVRARVAGESHICLRRAETASSAFQLSLRNFISDTDWTLVLADAAVSSLHAWQDRKPLKPFPDPVNSSALNTITQLELPWRLHLSPNEKARLFSPPVANVAVDRPSFRRAFYVSLREPGRAAIPMRAIFTPDGDGANDLPLHYGSGGADARVEQRRHELDENDRVQIHVLSSVWGRQGLLGSRDVSPIGDSICERFGFFDPQPFDASLLRLTARGGSLKADGEWDPPYLRARGADECSNKNGFALSLEAWRHVIGDGRTHYSRTVYRGFLLPFGHRASLIRITPREVELHPERGPLAASLQRYFVRVNEPLATFPREMQPPESANSFCNPEVIGIELEGDLQIDNPASSELAGRGPSAFIIHRLRKAHDFTLRVRSGGSGRMNLAFVDNTVTHDFVQLTRVLDEYNSSACDPFRLATFNKADVSYAPAIEEGQCTWPTDAIELRAVINPEAVNSVLLETLKRAPLFPVIDRARVRVRSIAMQTGEDSAAGVWVRYDPLYRNAAFDASANPAALYLMLEEPRPIRFRGRSDRSGGVANMDAVCKALARDRGPVGFSGNDRAGTASMVANVYGVSPNSGRGQVQSGFAFDRSAKLLGSVPIVALFEAVGLDQLPQLVEEVEERLEAAGQDLLAMLPDFVEDVRRVSNEALLKWRGTCSVDTEAWCKTSVYMDIETGLTALADAADEIEAQMAAQDAAETLKALGRAGKAVKSVARAVQSMAEKPEVALGQLLKASEFGAFFEWILQLRAAVGNGIKQILQRATLQAAGELARVIKLLDQYRAQALVLLGELELRSRASLLAVLEQVHLLHAELERQAKAWANARLDEIAMQLLSSITPVAARLQDIVMVRLGWMIDIEETLRKHQAEAKAWVKAVDEAAKRLEAQMDSYARDQVLDLLIKVENWAATTVYDPTIAGAAAVARELEPQLRAVRDLAMALRDGQARRKALGASNEIGALAFANAALAFLQSARLMANRLREHGPSWDAPAKALDDSVTNFAIAMADPLEPVFTGLLDAGQAWEALRSKLQADEAPALRAMLEELDPGKALPGGDRDKFEQALRIAIEWGAMPRCVRSAAASGSVELSACLDDWPLYQLLLDQARSVVVATWGGLLPVLRLAQELPGRPEFVSLEASAVARSAFGDDFFKGLRAISADASVLVALDPTLPPRDLPTIASAFGTNTALSRFGELVRRLDGAQVLRNLQASAIAEAEQMLRELARRFVPARINTRYEFDRDITREYCGVFIPGVGSATCTGDKTNAHLRVVTSMQADLLEGTSSFNLDGEISSFQINIFGLMTLPVEAVRFRADAKGFRMDPPRFCAPNLDGSPLAFLQTLMGLMGGKSGFFLRPMPNGVRAGYRFASNVVQSGGMTIQNFTIEAALVLPFDDRSAEVSFAVSSRDAPMLISVGIWGGGGFFEVVMAMDRIISIAASFEYGLVAAFDLAGVVRGQGRITVGLYYRQSASGTILEGFFYAGGEATVLGIVSICADLTVRLTYVKDKGGASGNGRFGVKIGAGPFSWTLRYSVGYDQPGEARSAALGGPTSAGLPLRTRAASSTVEPSSDLLDASTWAEYLASFEPLEAA